MESQKSKALMIVASLLLIPVLFVPASTLAHCDGMDGPVVKAAQKALKMGNVNLILIWVQKQDESEMRTAFQNTLAVRKRSAKAREVADMYFYETAVRLHRAGEGEPYSGLKPAGRDLGLAIPAADKAIETGSLDPLLKFFPADTHDGIRERFNLAIARKNFNQNAVDAGRQYVKAYVDLIHYVEHLRSSAEHASPDHQKAEKSGGHQDAHAMVAHQEAKGDHEMEFKIPESLKIEHDELHSELAKLMAAGGRVGDAAKEVGRLLHPHFVKEEEYAMPPLGLLVALAEGKVTPEMSKALAMTDKLKAELPEMLKEHKAIVVALEGLVSAAKIENKPEYVHFAEKLKLHAQTEEEVLYPASILVGEYLKLKVKK